MTSQRKKIVSLKQIEVLVEFLENHRDLAIGRLRSKEARALSHRLWSECATLLNAEPDGISRSPKEWQKWYTDYKSRILARQRQIKENISATGGGVGIPVVPLGATEERLCSLLKGSSQVLGREGTPPEQVRINPIHEIEEEIFLEPDFMEIPSNNDENYGEEVITVVEVAGEERQNSPMAEVDNILHQRSRHSRRPTKRSREEEVAQSANKKTELEDSRKILINMESLRCETTKLLANSIQQLAASLSQNAEATMELARATRNQRCSCHHPNQSDDEHL